MILDCPFINSQIGSYHFGDGDKISFYFFMDVRRNLFDISNLYSVRERIDGQHKRKI